MSGPLDRSLNRVKNEGEELKHRIEGLIHAVEFSDITLEQKSIFANEFSKLTSDVATFNEIISNTITNENIDLESYVIAPERISEIGTLDFLIVDKEKIKLVVKEEDLQAQNEMDPMELFDEGEEINNKIKDLNDTVSNSLDTLKRVFFRK